jgi:TPR repeat protein
MAMTWGAKSAGFVFAAIIIGIFAMRAASQAPFVKTTYGVAPAKETLWALTHDPLSDADIAKVNLDLFAKGDKDAAWELGLAYMQGFGVPEDFAKAEQMFRVGATDADRKAMVGMFYAEGYFPKDLDAVERWYTAAGRPQDYFEIAETYKAAAQNDKAIAPRYYARATTLYLALLKDIGHPEVRRAQLELGNLVVDGFYSAGDDANGRAQNLEWARMIAQELLGQEEYSVAVDYKIGQEDLSPDQAMWLRFCKRAAAYNIDIAQHYYVEALNQAEAKDFSGYDYVAWTRLASEKQTGELTLLKAFTQGMTTQQLEAANAAYDALVKTRKLYGAFYPMDDPLRNPSPEALSAMPQDDPDIEIRRAFSLEKAASTDTSTYTEVLATYRRIRDRRKMDVLFILGRNLMDGKNGLPKNISAAEYWLNEAAREGSDQARSFLHPPQNR